MPRTVPAPTVAADAPTVGWVELMQVESDLVTKMLDLQGEWWRQTENLMRTALGAWLAGERREVPTQPLFEPPVDVSPLALAQRTADAWVALGRVWLDALDHDLGASEPAKR